MNTQNSLGALSRGSRSMSYLLLNNCKYYSSVLLYEIDLISTCIHMLYFQKKNKSVSMSRGKIVMACQYTTNVKQCAYPANDKRKKNSEMPNPDCNWMNLNKIIPQACLSQKFQMWIRCNLTLCLRENSEFHSRCA